MTPKLKANRKRRHKKVAVAAVGVAVKDAAVDYTSLPVIEDFLTCLGYGDDKVVPKSEVARAWDDSESTPRGKMEPEESDAWSVPVLPREESVPFRHRKEPKELELEPVPSVEATFESEPETAPELSEAAKEQWSERQRERLELHAHVLDAFAHRTDKSFFGTVQVQLLDPRHSSGAGQCCKFLVAVFILVLQLTCLQTVGATLEDQMMWEDDFVWANGNTRQYASSWSGIYKYSVRYVAMPTFSVLVAVVFMVALAVAEKIKDDHVVAQLIACRICAPFLESAEEGVSLWRVAAALLLHWLRICVMIQFMMATAFIVGTSDGPLNVMLNSLAVEFLIEIDYMLADFDYKGVVPAALDAKSEKTDAELWRSTVHALLSSRLRAALWTGAAHGLVLVSAFACVFAQAFILQGYTSSGEPFQVKSYEVWHGGVEFSSLGLANHAINGARLALIGSLALATVFAVAPVAARDGCGCVKLVVCLLVELVALYLVYLVTAHLLVRDTILYQFNHSHSSESNAARNIGRYGRGAGL